METQVSPSWLQDGASKLYGHKKLKLPLILQVSFNIICSLTISYFISTWLVQKGIFRLFKNDFDSRVFAGVGLYIIVSITELLLSPFLSEKYYQWSTKWAGKNRKWQQRYLQYALTVLPENLVQIESSLTMRLSSIDDRTEKEIKAIQNLAIHEKNVLAQDTEREIKSLKNEIAMAKKFQLEHAIL